MAEPPVVGLQRDLSDSARDVVAEEHADKARVAAYQRLVKALVVSRGTVLQQLQSIVWHDDLQPRTIAFSRQFNIVQRAGKKQNGRYVCELRILEGSLSFSEEGERLETAAHRLMANIREWLSQVHRAWSMIADTYAQKKKTKMLNETLSAANETRHCKCLRGVVDESSASRGAMAEYVIRVCGQAAAHRWAVKPKDAKRHAST